MKTLTLIFSMLLTISTAFAAPPVLRSAWTTNAIPTAGTANDTTLTGFVNLNAIAATKLLAVDASKNIISGGSGTANTVAKFSTAGVLGNSLITDDATTVRIPSATDTDIFEVKSLSANQSHLAVAIYANYARLQSYGTGTGLGVISLQPLGNSVVIGGTAAPQKLTVVGGNILLDNARSYRIKNAGGSEVVALTIDAGDNLTMQTSGGGDVFVRAGAGSTAETYILKNTSGNVGFGFLSPSEKVCIDGGLHVGGTAAAGDNNATIDGVTYTQGYRQGFAAKTTTYVTTVNDAFLTGDSTGAAFTITLIGAATIGAGGEQTFKRINGGANTVKIDGAGGETIDGAADYDLTAQWQSVTIVSDGTNWLIK